MRRHLRWLLTIALVCSYAGEGLAQKKSFWKSVVAYLDSSNVKGVDPAYITQPDKPWAIVLNNNIDKLSLEVASTMQVKSVIEEEGMSEMTLHLHIKPPVSTSLGIWAGYRGYGAGYSLSLSGDNGYSFAMNMVSPSYGINLRINRFSFDKPEAFLSWHTNGAAGSSEDVLDAEYIQTVLSSPMKIGTLVLDGYWVFNKKRFSMLAAYDQSTIQLRSAGSLIAGLMYYYQKLDYDTPKNLYLLQSFTKMGLMKVYQGSIGLGYTYNWVPARGWVVNVTAMPVLTLLNLVKVSNYQLEFPDNLSDYSGTEWIDALTMKHVSDERLNGGVRLNLDMRMGVSYIWRNWYVGAVAQGHHFRSNSGDTTLKLTDWTIKTFIGMRL
jgi:hypothetical protein